VESRLGKGTAVQVYFPATAAGLDVGLASEREHHLAWRGQGRVLVVDDEPAVARLTSLVLEQYGFQVDVVNNGREALAQLSSSDRYRVVLVDLTMPDFSGIEVLVRARKQGCDTPMVLTSGYPRSEADQRFQDSDFSGFLQKPYRMENLVDVIRGALGET
jgi:CheY-like chemotaxis protein